MAIVDLNTGKIYGCKKGSKAWYHERAHIKFNKTDWGVRINYYGSFFQMVAIFILSLSIIIDWMPLRLFGLMNALGMILCWAFEEAWCQGRGLREYNKVN